MKKIFESEMQQAEIVLAAQSVLDDLQAMAEKIAKMEAEQIMPIESSMREQFGADRAKRFSNSASENLRAALEAIKNTKESIGSQVDQLSAIVDGEPVPENDMQSDTFAADDEVDDNLGFGDTKEQEVDQDIEDLFGDSANPPEGREKKESFNIKGNLITESDVTFLRNYFNNLVSMYDARTALNETAETFSLKKIDLIKILKNNKLNEATYQDNLVDIIAGRKIIIQFNEYYYREKENYRGDIIEESLGEETYIIDTSKITSKNEGYLMYVKHLIISALKGNTYIDTSQKYSFYEEGYDTIKYFLSNEAPNIEVQVDVHMK